MDELFLEVIGDAPLSPRKAPRQGSARRRSLFIALGLTIGVVAAVVLDAQGSTRSTSNPSTTSAASTTSASPSTSPVTQRTVTSFGGSLLPSATHTELIVHETGMLVRIDLDTGRVVRTPVPPITSSAPAFVIAGAHSVLVRPLDNVVGYLVPDDGEAQPLTGRLDQGTLWAFPGPQPGEVWLDSGNREPGPVLLQLVAFEGAPAAGSIALGGVVMPWGPDGTGQVVLTGSEGAFVSGGSNLPSRITFGTILAAGPTAWLIRGCSNQTAQTGQNICTVSAIDRRTGMVTTGKFGLLDGSPVPVSGTISPDGRAAAIVLGSPSQLAVIDMSSGKQILAGIHPLADPVWSLDGRYLFFSQDGTVEVFDRESGNVKTLGVDVRTTEAIAVRPSP